MKITLEKTIIFFISLATITLLSVLVIYFYNTKKIKSTSDLVEHTQEVTNKSDNVLLDVLNIETGLRGYILTGNDRFLQPYYNAITTRNNNLLALAELTKDNPNQQLRVKSLQKASDERLTSTKTIIEAVKQNELNESEKIVLIENAKVITDRIRGILTGINSEEFALLEQSKIDNENNSRNSEMLFLLLTVLVFVILGLIVAISKNQKAKNIIAEKLEKSILIAEQATQKAKESTQLKETFLANMSHEIRTPMNAIIGFSEILARSKMEEKEKGYVKIIKSAGANLLTIINDILDISKIEAGMVTFEEHPFSVKELFKSLSVMLAGKAKEKNLELLFTCDEDVPDSLLGDPTRLTQILINIVGNAIKFTQKGGVHIYAKLLKSTTENASLEFTIKDTGIGIPADKLEHIFERFRQAESQTTRKYGGTGLGLSIAKQLVELQGGNLSVKSELNAGSEFSFTISYKKTLAPLSAIINDKKTYKIEDLSKLNILLAEDNPLNVKLILSLFSENNLKVEVAGNGNMAIEKLKAGNFDVILMDMEMPVMNGYEATAIIRKELKNNIYIIAMTAHAMAGEREKCLGLGMNDYISKPITANQLFEKISQSISNS